MSNSVEIVEKAGGHRVELLGSWVDALTKGQLIDILAPSPNRPLLVLNHNIHSLALHERDLAFANLYQRADVIFIDGMPVVGIAKLCGDNVVAAHRVGVLDWIWPFFAEAERNGWVVTHVGSSAPTLEMARKEIMRRHPRLRLKLIPGYFDHAPSSKGTHAVIDEIHGCETDVLLLGLGMPLQERWLDGTLSRLAVPTIVTVGGIFGYLGGDRPTAPRWMGQLGVEWLYRLATEPRRLAYRYLVEPWALVRPVLRSIWERRLASRAR